MSDFFCSTALSRRSFFTTTAAAWAGVAFSLSPLT